jgi:hypothetical protein
MVFEYMNNGDVWDKFCSTFEVIHEDFLLFDAWYIIQGALGVTLANKWAKFIRATLDGLSCVQETCTTFCITKERRSRPLLSTPAASYSLTLFYFTTCLPLLWEQTRLTKHYPQRVIPLSIWELLWVRNKVLNVKSFNSPVSVST